MRNDAIWQSSAEQWHTHCLIFGASMDIHLVVIKPFGKLARGDIVTDKARISQILGCEHSRCVVRVAAQSARGD